MTSPSVFRRGLALLGACTLLLSVASLPTMAAELLTEEEMAKVVTTPSGLKYVDVKVGEGPEVKSGDKTQMHYVGRLMENGKKFDSSRDRGQTFPYVHKVSGVIPGWTEGVNGMKEGGIRKLIIPSRLGYGSRGAGGAIPPNADLFFEIEIVKIEN